jgi:hypothetical protein
MMEEHTGYENPITLEKLDGFALRFLAAELGYAALLVVIEILSLVITLIVPDSFGPFFDIQIIAVFAVLIPYTLAYLGNLIIGILGLVLYIQDRKQGYPGTGLLLNWIFVFSLFWVILLLVTVLLPQLIYYGF